MNKSGLGRVPLLLMALVVMATTVASANIADKHKKAQNKSVKKSEDVQRVPAGPFDLQQNVVSNVDFYTTNYGIFGYNIRNQVGGTFWPRGSNNQYIFAGGAWFAATKAIGSDPTDRRKRCMITYNPNSGQSWMVPGSHEDGTTVDVSSEGTIKNRTHFSTDFSAADGKDFAEPSYTNWPIWDTNPDDTIRVNNYYGLYVNDPEERTLSVYPKGPAFVSEEDIFAVYRDTDLSRYEGGAAQRGADGYPLGFQIEQIIYSWSFGDYADMLFIKYLFIHPEVYADTLYECWMAAVMDVDIALRQSPSLGAQNDRARYYDEEDTLNLAVQWTNGDRGEMGQGFGYLGFNFLESPAVDADGFLRKDKKQFPVQEQLGLRTMRNWPITEDRLTDEERYNFVSSGDRDGDNGPGDRRLLMATGPFNMRAGDSARIVIGLIMASTAGGTDATGTTEDMAELLRKVRFAQFVYNNQFRAPSAPDLPIVKGYNSGQGVFDVPEKGWLPLNNAMVIQWDSTAELTVDTLEGGMDFLGYRIYRARRTDLDTFDVDFRPESRRGPLAWKQIGQFGMVAPFVKTTVPTGTSTLQIDDFNLVDAIPAGSKRVLVARNTVNAAPWTNYFNDLFLARRPGYALTLNGGLVDINRIDKFDSVRFVYYTTQFDTLPPVSRTGNGQLDSAQAAFAKDSLIKLIIDKKVIAEPILFRDLTTVPGPDGPIETVRLRPWQETREVRHEVVAPFMRQISRNRTFYDVGDDNRNGTVSYDADPEKSEKLINNIDYYYAVRAYDEGDFLIGTNPKLSSRAVGLSSTVKTTPLGSRPGATPTIEIEVTPENRALLGGIYNVRMPITDAQRFNQLFAGKTLELIFYRDWFSYNHDRQDATPDIALYNTLMVLRDSVTGEILNNWQTALPPQLCGGVRNFAGWFTENSVTWVDTAGLTLDTIGTDNNGAPIVAIYDTLFSQVDGTPINIDTTTFMSASNTERVIRTGSYQSDAACFPNKYALGTIGIAFDYGIQQFGGVYRTVPEGEILQGGDPNIYVGAGAAIAKTYDEADTLNPPPVWYETIFPDFVWELGTGRRFLFPQSYNNGPGVYEITFEEGDPETITTKFILSDLVGDEDGKNDVMTFENVPTLNMRVRNVLSYDRPDLREDGTVGTATVSYPFDLTRVDVPILDSNGQRQSYPDASLVPIGSFATAAYGWRNSQDSTFRRTRRRNLAAGEANGWPLGVGKYYVSRTVSTTGKDTLDFVNTFMIGGASFTIDFSRRGFRSTSGALVPTDFADPSVFPKTDFKAGDKVRVSTFGGALGFPFNRATVRLKVGQYDPELAGVPYTDEQLEQVTIAPNPYYVTHEGIRSSFEGRLFFGRLPRKATIDIFTTTGDLVVSFEHDESTSQDPSTFGADVWDLMNKNGQRVASQLLVAKISTPDGASITRKFAIVVGPARLVRE